MKLRPCLVNFTEKCISTQNEVSLGIKFRKWTFRVDSVYITTGKAIKNTTITNDRRTCQRLVRNRDRFYVLATSATNIRLIEDDLVAENSKSSGFPRVGLNGKLMKSMFFFSPKFSWNSFCNFATFGELKLKSERSTVVGRVGMLLQH